MPHRTGLEAGVGRQGAALATLAKDETAEATGTAMPAAAGGAGRPVEDGAAPASMPPPRPFSPMQWYLGHARNTVYFAALTSLEFSEADFHDLVRQIMEWAPQLHGRADFGAALHEAIAVDHRRLCRYARADDLDRALAEIVAADGAVFADPALPSFRADCVSLADAAPGMPRTLFVCRTSHALMEGSETSRLMRARPSLHHGAQSRPPIGPLRGAALAFAGAAVAPFHLAMSRLPGREAPGGRATVIDIDRGAVRRLAGRLGVRQRSLLFTLALHSLNGDARDRPKKAHLVSYSTLPEARTTLEDSALNLRMQVARFPALPEFEAHAARTDAALARENTTEIYSQALYNAILKVHRRLQRIAPGLYDERFFTFIPYDFVLSLLPPHMSGGALRDRFDGPVYCGSYTPGVTSVVFVPHRRGISLNIFARPSVVPRLDRLGALLDRQGIGWRKVF